MPVRNAIFKPDVFADPILSKRELENLNPQDPIHFKKIRPPLTAENNAMSYNPTIKYLSTHLGSATVDRFSSECVLQRKFTNMIMREGRLATARKQIDKVPRRPFGECEMKLTHLTVPLVSDTFQDQADPSRPVQQEALAGPRQRERSC